jgi:glucose 1-dehydrogenase
MNTLTLDGMIALVTGGAQGIGAGICYELAFSGASVGVIDLQLEKAQDIVNTISENGGKAIAIKADITSEIECKQAVNKLIKEYGNINILVNCAAPKRKKENLKKIMNEDFEQHNQVVIKATAFLSDLVSKNMKENENNSIVNISSVIGSTVALDQCSLSYHITKAGLDHLTRWMAVQFGSRGIRVNAIAPGLVDRDVGIKLTDSNLNKLVINEIVPLQRAGKAKDIGQAVVFLCSKNSSYITGQVITVDGGMGLNEVFGAASRTIKVAEGII